ncbi:uncharacterized protein VTP21DRAFT_3699 [Calcarisporiella thermophila]|uniref:uncharacterized protein n=1 Tax=Calcarisporiella thermophila TaxID=911321 RepID=UPI003744A648
MVQPIWKRRSNNSGSEREVSKKSGNIVVGSQFSHASNVASSVAFSNSAISGNNNRTSIMSTGIRNFSEFISETNDEWDDCLDFGDVQSSERKTEQVYKVVEVNTKASGITPESTLSSVNVIGTGSNSKMREGRCSTSDIKSEVEEREGEVRIKREVAGLLLDPTASLKILPDMREHGTHSIDARTLRLNKFREILQAPNIDLGALRGLSWNGVPEELRPMVWQLLLGYLPCNADRRVATLARKRKEYQESVAQAFSRGQSGLDPAIWRQIRIDVPRTNPGIPLYQYKATQECLERILYVWAIRHPASGYVQGINDLVTPFFQVFLSAYIEGDPEVSDPARIPQEILSIVEADSFWCLTRLLGTMLDNYTVAQPGIQRLIATLKDLVCRIDAPLADHLNEEGIEFIQFAFRWMNCLLMREFRLCHIIRLWDAYFSEGADGFATFHLYVCAAFLVKWSEQLRRLDFQGVMMFLQSLPTQHWTEQDVALLLSEAYMWKSLFHNSPNHLVRTSN